MAKAAPFPSSKCPFLLLCLDVRSARDAFRMPRHRVDNSRTSALAARSSAQATLGRDETAKTFRDPSLVMYRGVQQARRIWAIGFALTGCTLALIGCTLALIGCT